MRKLQEQFAIRSAEFDISANWIIDRKLIKAHTDLAGKPHGRAMDLCCGTGQIGRSLKEAGWDIQGLDICNQMLKISGKYFPVLQGNAEELTFASDFFDLVVCRQAFQFLKVKEVLAQVSRVLIPGGTFILSLTVPFSEEDRAWLYEIHRIKQPLLLKFFTTDELIEELRGAGFLIEEIRNLKVRESVVKWMRYAPELSQETKEKVLSAVRNAPVSYKRLHNVQVEDKDVSEDWNWVILKASFPKK